MLLLLLLLAQFRALPLLRAQVVLLVVEAQPLLQRQRRQVVLAAVVLARSPALTLQLLPPLLLAEARLPRRRHGSCTRA